MHRFAKPPGAGVDRGETRIRRSGHANPEFRIDAAGRCICAREAVGKDTFGSAACGQASACVTVAHNAPGAAASLSGRRFRLRGKRPRATRFAEAGWQGARNVTELVCCVTNEKAVVFVGFLCVRVSGMTVAGSGKAGDNCAESGCRARRRTASRSRHAMLRHFAKVFRQNCSYACAEFAKPFCFASSQGARIAAFVRTTNSRPTGCSRADRDRCRASAAGAARQPRPAPTRRPARWVAPHRRSTRARRPWRRPAKQTEEDVSSGSAPWDDDRQRMPGHGRGTA